MSVWGHTWDAGFWEANLELLNLQKLHEKRYVCIILKRQCNYCFLSRQPHFPFSDTFIFVKELLMQKDLPNRRKLSLPPRDKEKALQGGSLKGPQAERDIWTAVTTTHVFKRNISLSSPSAGPFFLPHRLNQSTPTADPKIVHFISTITAQSNLSFS